jgi:hypothetical protein
MCKIIIVLFFLATFICNGMQNVELDLMPISYDLEGVLVKNDTIISYGDFGSCIISINSGLDWEQYKIFKKGKIVKAYLKNQKIILFNSNGEIAETNIDFSDSKIIDEHKLDILDSITALINYPSGYFLRTKTKMIILNEKYDIIYEININSRFLPSGYPLAYKNSLAYYKNFLIAELDSISFLRINLENLFSDTIVVKNIFPVNIYSSRYCLISESEYFYFQIGDTLVKTSDFIDFEKIYINGDPGLYTIFKKYDNQIFAIKYPLFPGRFYKRFFYKLYNLDENIILITENKSRLGEGYFSLKDFCINNNQIVLVGVNKSIIVNKLQDTVINIQSFSINKTNTQTPVVLKDSSLLFLFKYSNGIWGSPFPNISNTKGIFLNTTMPDFRNTDSTIIEFSNLQHLLFDEESEILYMLGSNKSYSMSGITTTDLGKTYTIKPLQKILYKSTVRTNSPSTPNIIKRGDKLITFSHTYHPYSEATWSMFVFNTEFELLDVYYDSLMVVNYLIDWIDFSIFTLLSYDNSEKLYKIQSTSDKGQSWNIEKSYNPADSMIYFQEVEINTNKYFFAVYYNKSDSIASIDALSIDTKQINTIFQWKSHSPNSQDELHTAICSENDTLHIAVEDTIFYITNIFDRDSWKFIILPNNGRIIRAFQKYGNRYYARYYDDETEENVYWFTMKFKELPVILAEDCLFDSVNIYNSVKTTKNIKIYNQSNETDLQIYGFSKPTHSAFKNEFQWNDSLKSIDIKPNEYFELPISFQPTEVITYIDSIFVYSNALEVDSVIYLSGSGYDTTTSIIDYNIDLSNYLYIFPPYPTPSNEKVNILFYFDSSFDFEKNNIQIIDIYGRKIAGKSNIIFNKQSNISSILTWNCSAVADAVYLLVISHGNTKRVAKIMVSR